MNVCSSAFCCYGEVPKTMEWKGKKGMPVPVFVLQALSHAYVVLFL